MAIDRRLFLLGSLGAGALARAGWAGPAGRGRSPGPERTLVLVQLSGGNDGLATLVPHGDDACARARSSTRREAGDILPIDERVGLHPALRRLHAIHQEGQVAWIEGVGYPRPNRSHFRSLDIWHAADPRGRAVGEGWVGRLLGELEAPAVTAVVHVGPRPPFALQSSERPPVSLIAGRVLAPPVAPDVAPELESSASAPTLEFIRRATRDARAAAGLLQTALASHVPAVTYPDSGLAQDLRSAAALVHAEVGVRVASVELDGFDTHRDQRERHDRLMAELDGGLGAFLADLATSEAGRETLVLVFSEFGRRLAENGSRGTDHGAAGLALALGARVRGGLHGRPPARAELDDGDPVFTTDFRSVYARAIEHCFGIEHERVLGERFPTQEWV